MPDVEYNVSFIVHTLGHMQGNPLRVVDNEEMNTAFSKRFLSALSQKFPRGRMSADLKTFITDEPVPLVDLGANRRYYSMKVPALLTSRKLITALGNYIDNGSSSFNSGSITFTPSGRVAPPVSATAVSKIADDKNLPPGVEAEIKKFGGKKSRKAKKSRRRKMTRKH